MDKLYQIFDELGITDYEVHEHPAIYTIAEGDDKGLHFTGLNLKNLLLKDKKDGEYYLVILDGHKKLDRKKLGEITGWSNKIRFANEEELFECLNLMPGSVSPFGIINDTGRHVTIVLGNEIHRAPEDELMNFHPNRNTATLSISKRDFLHFLHARGVRVIFEV